MSDGLRLDYTPPGPVSAAFIASQAPVRAIMGPIGSGKTTACLMDVTLYAALRQNPSPIDGVRRLKCTVIRDTLINLKRTTIPSWHKNFPETLGDWSGGDKGPWEHRLRFDLRGGSAIDMVVAFIGIGDNAIEDVCRGLETTTAYLNEADLLAPDVLPFIKGRLGRYPEARHGRPAWSGLVCDFNAPDMDNWTYRDFVEAPKEGFAFFRQPSGLSPKAENLHNLPDGYYAEAASGMPDWYVRRMIRNEFGYSRDGKPVFEAEFSDDLHVARVELAPAAGLPIVLGCDGGLTPAAVIWQEMPDGQWRALDEITTERAGPKAFGRELARLLKHRYEGVPIGGAWGDPAATYGADRGAGERDWLAIVSAESGVRFRAAPTNKLIPRLEAWREPMRRLIDGDKPGLLVSPRCRVTRKALNASYRYRRVMIGTAERFSDEPEKSHPFSDVIDAGGYGLLGGGVHAEVMGRRRAGRAQAAYVPSSGGYDPLSTAW